jgi:hypothetical protein
VSTRWILLLSPFFVGVSPLGQTMINNDPSAPRGCPVITADDMKLGTIREHDFLLNVLDGETDNAGIKLQISQVRSRASDAVASLSR